MTIYATFSHPTNESEIVPGVLLIAGSGPTDRNGNSAVAPGPVNTLKALADWLSDDGVATLRYDKLGSGATGLGPYALDPASIGLSVSEQEARSALAFLAKEKDVNDHELGVFGRSEGAPVRASLGDGAHGNHATDSRPRTLRTVESALPRPHHGPGRRVIEGAGEIGRDHDVTRKDGLGRSEECDYSTASYRYRQGQSPVRTRESPQSL